MPEGLFFSINRREREEGSGKGFGRFFLWACRVGKELIYFAWNLFSLAWELLRFKSIKDRIITGDRNNFFKVSKTKKKSVVRKILSIEIFIWPIIFKISPPIFPFSIHFIDRSKDDFSQHADDSKRSFETVWYTKTYVPRDCHRSESSNNISISKIS